MPVPNPAPEPTGPPPTSGGPTELVTPDQRTITIVAAAPGWHSVNIKDDHELESEGLKEIKNIHDVAWVEPIPCFALVENTEVDGDQTYTERMVKPVVRLESYHFGIPGDDITDADEPSLILGPTDSEHAPWVLERCRRHADRWLEKQRAAK
jgi:hypothetical protein